MSAANTSVTSFIKVSFTRIKDGELLLCFVPMSRFQNREELAGAVIYLASNASSYVTYLELHSDGGVTLWATVTLIRTDRIIGFNSKQQILDTTIKTLAQNSTYG